MWTLTLGGESLVRRPQSVRLLAPSEKTRSVHELAAARQLLRKCRNGAVVEASVKADDAGPADELPNEQICTNCFRLRRRR